MCVHERVALSFALELFIASYMGRCNPGSQDYDALKNFVSVSPAHHETVDMKTVSQIGVTIHQ